MTKRTLKNLPLRTYRSVGALLTGCGVLITITGCATQPGVVAYGHPALSAVQPPPQVIAAPPPTVIVVAQPIPIYGYASSGWRGPYLDPSYAGDAPVPVSPTAARDNTGRAVAGALIGGVVGSTVGKGSGRAAAAALGVGLGTWLAVRD